MKDFEKMWKHFPQKVKLGQANHLLDNCMEHAIHQVNKLVIFNIGNPNPYYWVVNKESKHCSCFETEQQAIDYCLDFYPQSFFNVQLGVFEK